VALFDDNGFQTRTVEYCTAKYYETSRACSTLVFETLHINIWGAECA